MPIGASLTTWVLFGCIEVAFLLSGAFWRLAASVSLANPGPSSKEEKPMMQTTSATFSSCLFNTMAALCSGLASGCLLL